MHHRSYRPHERDRWLFCITAVAEVIHALPSLYRVVEAGTDDVRLELNMKAGAWEVLRFEGASGDHVAASLSHHLDSPPAFPFPEWLTKATGRLESDLQWADYRSCSEQRNEILSALITFRGSMLRGEPY